MSRSFTVSARALLAAGLLWPVAGHSQSPPPAPAAAAAPASAPTSQQIIDALKGGRSRSMRNLGVAEATPPAAQGGGAAPLAAAPVAAPVAAPALPAAAAAGAAAAVRPARPAPPSPIEPPWPPKPAAIDLAIQFEFNSNKVTPESQKTLSELAQALISPDLAGLRFLVQGHTDGKGLASYNLKLSQARAEQVKRILVQHKVAAARLVAEGRGAAEPLDTSHPDAPENRRVRIITLGN
ncbi:MAG: OmpA family protein [Pseudomonadota bacterium]